MLITSQSTLREIIEKAKKKGKSVLIKKGVFDIIHPGHIFAIQKFKEKADVVIILIQSDEFTRKKKGPERPINTQMQRAEVIDGIKGVDYVFLDTSSSRDEYIALLNYLKPTILAVTSVDAEKTKQYSSEFWELVEFPDKNKEGYSTTDIINRVLKNYSQGSSQCVV